MLEWRLKAYRHWLNMKEPNWANIKYQPIDYQDIIFYSAPKQKVKPKSLDEIDPELRRTFEKLGISLDEQKRLTGVAVDAVIDSVSIGTTFKDATGRTWRHLLLYERSYQGTSGPCQKIPEHCSSCYR